MSAHAFSTESVSAPESRRLNSTGHDGKCAPRRPTAIRFLSRRFSAAISTEDLHTSKGAAHFYGAYGQIRKELDYTYHAGAYNKERQFLHDSIIEGT
jgi:hypothetical protein